MEYDRPNLRPTISEFGESVRLNLPASRGILRTSPEASQETIAARSGVHSNRSFPGGGARCGRAEPAESSDEVTHANDFGFDLPEQNADPERELQGECSGPRSIPGQVQTRVIQRAE